MIKVLLNFINFFRVKNKLRKLKLKFYSEGPINNLGEVSDLDLKKRIVREIIKFNKSCDLSYKNISTNENLKISGLWKELLVRYKKEQLEAYNTGDINKIILLHENMFYNPLIEGLWNYTHLNDLGKNYSSLILFLKDLYLYRIIFRDYSGLSSSNKIKKWGYQHGNDKFHFLDISSKIQKNLISNSLNLLNDKKKFNILEIGGGFGSLAERMFEEERINSYTIVDIPSTLLIAYYYLCSKFGTNTVEILHTSDSIESKFNTKSKKIYLIPSCFFDKVKNYQDFDLLCNFASFSEMSFETIKYYLDNLPSQIKIIISSNSNIPSKTDIYEEVINDEFPIPKNFVLSFSTVQIPFYSNWRYKTKIYTKGNG